MIAERLGTSPRLALARWLAALLALVACAAWAPAARADDFTWRELLYEPFDALSRWELDPGWGAEGGALAGTGPAAARLAFPAPWRNHRLMLRFSLAQGGLTLRLREGAAGRYWLRLDPAGLTLAREGATGAREPLGRAELALGPGWHTLLVTLHEDHLMAALDGAELLDCLDLAPLRQGALALELAAGDRASVDDLWITGLLPLPDEPPDAARVQVGGADDVGGADADGFAPVVGQAGAVPAGATVYALNLETLDFATATATAEGSFQARLFAPPGATVQVNWGYPGALPIFESIGLEGSPALLLSAPLPSPTAYAVGGRLGDGHWVARGEGFPAEAAPGDVLTATLQLRGRAAALAWLDPGALRLELDLGLQRIFDEAGQQLPLARVFVSAYLTPSGLPVEAEQEAADPWLATLGWPGSALELQGRALSATLPITLALPADLPAGVYRPRLRLRFLEPAGAGWAAAPSLGWNDDSYMAERQDPTREYPWPLLPPVTVGEPAAPRLAWSLLADYSSNSERGVRAAEDGHYALAPRTAFSSGVTILPREDIYGQPVAYTLEPSLPLTSWGIRPTYERVALCPPALPLAYPAGEVRARVVAPDGQTTDLGASPFLAGLNPLMMYRPDQADPKQAHRTLIQGFGNPGPADTYRGWTGNPALRYVFTQYGRYTITLSGEMRDIWGRAYPAGGTYEVWIARPLDLELGTLPGTPFEVGDAYSPAVRVQPGVPAEIAVDVTLYVNSSPADARRYHAKGRANPYGAYHPGAGAAAFRFEAPGEYDALVTARYWDAEGALWMGAVRGAGVVETPQTPLVAHGERGIRSFVAVKRPLWFAEGRSGNVVPGQTDGLYRERDLGGALHLPYPYMSGDVVWMVDREGENSVFPTLTLDDTRGEIADLIQARLPALAEGAWYYGQFPRQLLPLDRRAIGELPLVSTTTAGRREGATTGWPVGQFPALVDQAGYFYASCVRADLSVAHLVAESGLGNAYWFADDNYNLQYGQGVNGDIAPDFKINFGGAVFRDAASGINQYAIYASADVYIAPGEAQSNRTMPPFQGAAGGPDGGPLLTLEGEAIDLFIQPTAARPGTILQVGETFSFAGQFVPTLASRLAVTVTLPSGATRHISGQANKIGYFYDPAQDFVATEAGVYRVQVRGWHDGATSAGPVAPPYPQGSVLGAARGWFDVYVVAPAAPPLEVAIPQRSLARAAQPLEVEIIPPAGWEGLEARYTLSLSGAILEQGTLAAEGGRLAYVYDPMRLNADHPNLDVSIIAEQWAFIPWDEPEAADTVQLDLFVAGAAGGRAVQAARAITLQGAQLLAPDGLRRQYLPRVMAGTTRP
ncbi:MAG: hypothetical protein GXY76_08200 [Chloroflexi bacterium]|nr:hypothetical protein [Chloroflexota bacterium]